MARNRNKISINSEWLTPHLGDIVIGYNCAITNVQEMIQMVRFRSSQMNIKKYNYLVNKWGQ